MEGLKATALRPDEGRQNESTYPGHGNIAAMGTIRFLGYDRESRGVNQVDLWLLLEELPLFMQALVAHRLLLPTEYMQTIERGDGGYHVRIRSHESPKIFVARLSAALKCLKHPA